MEFKWWHFKLEKENEGIRRGIGSISKYMEAQFKIFLCSEEPFLLPCIPPELEECKVVTEATV